MEPSSATCPNGHMNPPTDRFCATCGIEIAPRRSSRNRAILVIAVATVVIAAPLIAYILTRPDAPTTASSSRLTTSTTSLRDSTTSTPPSTITPSTIPSPRPTELEPALAYNPTKCGIDASPKPYPHSATRTYEVTATIALWSDPTTHSRQLRVIPVTRYGQGGIGCPDGQGPTVTIVCMVPDGEMISGPFGNDPVWLRTFYDGASGYVTDQWVDTEWDVGRLPICD